MTQVEDPKHSLSVEDVLPRKRKLKAKAIDISAKNAQVSETTPYRKAKELIQQNLSEEQRNKLRLGKITIDKAYRQLKNQEKRQDLLSNGTISNIQFSHSIRLIGGDLIEVSKDIPDDSIGLVFTDPPYQRGRLPFYEPLGKIAFRVLKEGGSVVMYAGHYALPETGTTAIAAIKLKRRFVGIEKNAETLAIARSRISAMISGEELVSGDKKMKVSDNLVGKIRAIK
jgi:16S rRNA G966 N2-methylase RsmD